MQTKVDSQKVGAGNLQHNRGIMVRRTEKGMKLTDEDRQQLMDFISLGHNVFRPARKTKKLAAEDPGLAASAETKGSQSSSGH